MTRRINDIKMARASDLTGEVFGRLKVLRLVSCKGDKSRKWECLCSCGKYAYPTTTGLNTGNTKSCGCLKEEVLLERNKIHSMCHTDEYNIWRDMKKRCKDKNNPIYGGKGISVCNEWEDFLVFYNDMGAKPGTKSSLERVDNSKGYCKSNCIWADRSTQSAHRNRQKNNTTGYIGITKNKRGKGYITRVGWKGHRWELLCANLESAILMREIYIQYKNLPHTRNTSLDMSVLISKNKNLLAGGDWRVVSKIIEEELCDKGWKVIVYVLTEAELSKTLNSLQ